MHQWWPVEKRVNQSGKGSALTKRHAEESQLEAPVIRVRG